jgi:predicted dehydrogenase
MKQVLISKGKASVVEIPAPQVESGKVLVRVLFSCISSGTEMSGLKNSGIPLWKKAITQPEKVEKLLQMVDAQGLKETRSFIASKRGNGGPTGYSAAGTIIEVGEGIHHLKPGDYVACAGAQCAFHAEIIRVPANLTVKLPKNLDLPSASTVTLGAIALQGVRRAQPTLGETFVVVGLGGIGQLTAQLLKTNGCRVIGIDPDRARIALAQQNGMDRGTDPEAGNDVLQVMRLTDGGADGVIITAASSSNTVISTAFQMCRKKGRVVLVGEVGLHLNRADFYEKELDFLISSSSGPGRYDANYEEKGWDYPAAYVRWTENRNMAEFLRLLAEGRVQVQPLITAVYPIAEAASAYEQIKNGAHKPLLVLLSYPNSPNTRQPVRVISVTANKSDKGVLRLALVGAGNFAKAIHLPNIKSLRDRIHLQAVMSHTGHNAAAVAKQFGANYATTDYQAILDDSEIDAVLLATRHHLHATMALAALKAGKHVLLEKPLALNRQELAAIVTFFETNAEHSPPILLTGFNRRFSKWAQTMKNLVRNRTNPMIMNYRMNAGYIPRNHWVQTAEGGGRNIGEACHIYDLFTYLTDSEVTSVEAIAITPRTADYGCNDNFITSLKFADGSVATLTYTALGSADYPKEQLEIYFDGKVMALNDYKKLILAGSKSKRTGGSPRDKGQLAELVSFVEKIAIGVWPIPLWQQVQAMEIAFRVEELLNRR